LLSADAVSVSFFSVSGTGAAAGGVLAKAIGGEGSVKIEKENGRYQHARCKPAVCAQCLK
jgi:hypothetical protein